MRQTRGGSGPTLMVPSPEPIPDSKIHGANMGPVWGQQYPGRPHVGLTNVAIWDVLFLLNSAYYTLINLEP